MTLLEQFEAYLVEAGFRPGDRLPGELELAQRFGVSRGTIREIIVRAYSPALPGVERYWRSRRSAPSGAIWPFSSAGSGAAAKSSKPPGSCSKRR